MLASLEEVTRKFAAAGAAVRESALPAGFADVVARHRTVMAVEASQFHELRLRRHPEDYKPNIRALLEEGLACPAPAYAATKQHQRLLQKQTHAWLADGGIALTPATLGPAPAAATTGDPAFNSPWSYTGMPTVSFPTGHFEGGLPLAIQLVGPRGSEQRLFEVGRWCEKVLDCQPLEPPA